MSLKSSAQVMEWPPVFIFEPTLDNYKVLFDISVAGSSNYGTIRINFLDTNPLVDANAAKLDEKKSGDYIIIEARHNYRIEKFDTTLLCAKIGSIGEQQEMFA